MKLVKGERIFTLVLLLILISMLAVTYNWPLSARLIPLVGGIPTTLLVIYLFIRGIIKAKPGGDEQRQPRPGIVDVWEDTQPVEIVIRRGLPVALGILGLVLTAWLFGFTIAIPLFTFLYLKIVGRERWWLALAVAICIGIFVYFLLDRTLRIGWPHSLIGG